MPIFSNRMLLPVLLSVSSCGGWNTDLDTLNADAGEETLAETADASFDDIGPAATKGQSLPLPPKAWPAGKDCAERLDRVLHLSEEDFYRLDPDSATIAILPLQHDHHDLESLPFPLIRQTQSNQYLCVLTVDRRGFSNPQFVASNDRRVFRTARLRSTFPKGTKRRTNPEYKRLESDIKAARKKENEGSSSFETGDPLLDLIGFVAGGVIEGASSYFGKSELQELEDKRETIDPFVEEPVMTTYSYDLSELETRRHAQWSLTLSDQTTGQVWHHLLKSSETLSVALSDNRHPKDMTVQHSPQFRLMNSTDLSLWERSAPPLPMQDLRNIATAWAASAPMPASIATLEQNAGPPLPVEQTLEVSPPVAKIAPIVAAKPPVHQVIEPAAASGHRGAARIADGFEVIRIGKDRRAVAFHVAEDTLLAPIDSLPQSSLIELVYPGKTLVYGLIEERDSNSGMARIFSPRSFEPLDVETKATSPVEIKGQAPSAHGTPVLVDQKVHAVWFENGQMVSASRFADLIGNKN